jgi:uncharacterized protein YutE (UPF0331/DUF86 family)
VPFHAKHVVSEKGGAVPETYADSVERLGGLGVLDSGFAAEFSRVAKLRNVLVHLYDNVDIEFLFSLVSKLIADLKRFLKELKL